MNLFSPWDKNSTKIQKKESGYPPFPKEEEGEGREKERRDEIRIQRRRGKQRRGKGGSKEGYRD